MVDDKYREGEAIANSIATKLGPDYSVTYQPEKEQWEIAKPAVNITFGSFKWTEEGWKSNINPAIAHNASRLIGGVVSRVLERANQAIAPSNNA